MSSFAPYGGLVSTIAESLRFLRAFFGGELLTPDQLRLITSRRNRLFFPLQYGYGLMRFEVPRWMSPFKARPELVGHSGPTGPFAFFNPKPDLYVAGTLNQMDKPNRPFRLMPQVIGLLDRLLGSVVSLPLWPWSRIAPLDSPRSTSSRAGVLHWAASTPEDPGRSTGAAPSAGRGWVSWGSDELSAPTVAGSERPVSGDPR
jgi:CubicO group peptidase (beta-lactamase class C family)